MKKTITVEANICDFCDKEHAFYKCINCGKDFCFDCLKKEAKRYKSTVHQSGNNHDDGIYCFSCDKEKQENTDELHSVYKKIESLSNEAKELFLSFRKRVDVAENELKNILSNSLLSKRS